MENEIQLIDISNRGMSKAEREKLQQQQQQEALRKLAAQKQKEELVIQRKDAARQRSIKIRKNLRRGGIASVTGLSILLAGLFQSPSDLIQQQTINQLTENPAIEIMLDDDSLHDDNDSRRKVETAPVRKGFFARVRDSFRNFFLRLPQYVRVCVCIPLWAIGYAIIHLFSLLFPVTLQPLLHHILSWLLLAVVLLAVFAVTMKSLFPHMPWRKILRKRNLLIILAASLVLKAADMILPLFWADYAAYKYPVMLGCGVIVLLLIFTALLRRRKRKKPA